MATAADGPARAGYTWFTTPATPAGECLEKRRSMSDPSFAFVASDAPEACDALALLEARYPTVAPEEAEVIVALGGDGFVLETLHRYLENGTPIYGMNCGTVGFLMNLYDEEDLPRRLGRAKKVTLHPLAMTAHNLAGETLEALAINEVS